MNYTTLIQVICDVNQDKLEIKYTRHDGVIGTYSELIDSPEIVRKAFCLHKTCHNLGYYLKVVSLVLQPEANCRKKKIAILTLVLNLWKLDCTVFPISFTVKINFGKNWPNFYDKDYTFNSIQGLLE